MAVVFVDIDPAEVDVNVHPQKTQIRFVNERAVFSAVQSTVQHAVVDRAPAPGLPIRPSHELEAWSTRRDQILRAGAQSQFSFQTGTSDPLTSLTPQPSDHAASGWSTDASPAHHDALASPAGESADAPEEEVRAAEASGKLPPLRVVGQVGALYIIAEGPQGVFLIDQHAAHERILYEQFMAAQRQGAASAPAASQQILDPIPLHMGHETTGLVGQYLDELNRIGFQIEPFGGDTFLLRGVPVVLSGQDPERITQEIVSSLALERDLVADEMEARLVKMVCKRAAIKAGQLLSDIEMRELVRQLEACESPRTCPHGRPTMLQLSAGELEKAFGRV